MARDARYDRFLGFQFDTYEDALTAFCLVFGRKPYEAEEDMLRSRVKPAAHEDGDAHLAQSINNLGETVGNISARVADLEAALRGNRFDAAISEERSVRANTDQALTDRIAAATARYKQSVVNLADQLRTLRLDQQANNPVEGSAAELSARIVEAMNLINSEELNNLDSLCAHDKDTLQRIISAVKRALVA